MNAVEKPLELGPPLDPHVLTRHSAASTQLVALDKGRTLARADETTDSQSWASPSEQAQHQQPVPAESLHAHTSAERSRLGRCP